MIVVIGALALDVVACRQRFLAGTSNPAAIRWAPGGVGYRIWRRLPSPKRFISAVGEDPAGRWLAECLTPVRRGTRSGPAAPARSGGRLATSAGAGRGATGAAARILRLGRLPTACYSALMQAGRLLYGAADMRIIERGLTWKRVAPLLPVLGSRDLLVLEANLAPSLVRQVIRRQAASTRLVFESVSVEKLLRHREHLRGLYLLCANREELAALRAHLAPGSRRESAGWLGAFMASRRIAHLLAPRGRLGARLYRLEAQGRVAVRNRDKITLTFWFSCAYTV
jgi:hypothetical protein